MIKGYVVHAPRSQIVDAELLQGRADMLARVHRELGQFLIADFEAGRMRALDLTLDARADLGRERALTVPASRREELAGCDGRHLRVELFALLRIDLVQIGQGGVAVDEAFALDGVKVLERDHLGAVGFAGHDRDEAGRRRPRVRAVARQERGVLQRLEGVDDVRESETRWGAQADDELERRVRLDVREDGAAPAVQGSDLNDRGGEDAEEWFCCALE